VAVCVGHILGGDPRQLRVWAPSQAVVQQPFDILVRPEDIHANPATRRPEHLSVLLGDQRLPFSATPVAQSTCMRVRIALPCAGMHRITVVHDKPTLEATSNPVRCTDAGTRPEVLWGMIHGHTEMSDGTGTLEQYFRQMRDESLLDFCAPGDHDHVFETPDAMWEKTCAEVKRWHNPRTFVTFLGYEWAKWRKNGDGDRNVYFSADDRPMYRSENGQFSDPPLLFNALHDNQETAIVIPHHTGHGGNFCDFKDHDPQFERLIEIFQIRGSYECAPDEDNPVPERHSREFYPDGTIRRALEMGWRVGFTAGGDNHAGTAGTQGITDDKDRYKEGLTGVVSKACTRKEIWDAMYARRTIATTGERILLDWTLNQATMGSELQATEMPGLRTRRSIRAEFHGTAPLRQLDIIRNNQIVHTLTEPLLDLEHEWTDNTLLDDSLLPPARHCDHAFCFYYVRAVQQDAEVVWGSPIWIDP